MGILSGMSKRERQAFAADSERMANEEAKGAREARSEAAKYRKSLKSGKSGDPAADRYMIREYEASARIQEANARDLRNSAKSMRKWWS